MPFALALTAILAVLTCFQLALVLGAPMGRFAWGGAHRILPGKLRVGSAVAVIIYAAIAVIAFARLRAIDLLPPVVATVAMWAVFAYFVLGIVMNALSRSKPERWTMTPITIVLAALSLPIALGAGTMASAI